MPPRGSEPATHREISYLPDFCVRCQLEITALGITYRASCLAFTDWSRSYRQMAIRGASTGRKYFEWIYHRKFRGPALEALSAQSPSEKLTLNREVLGMELLPMCAGTRVANDLLELPKNKFVGADFDGMLLIDYRAVEPSLEPGPIFIIREGEFSLGGERRSVLREGPFYMNWPRPQRTFDDYLSMTSCYGNRRIISPKRLYQSTAQIFNKQ
jgi:hypothetical protein